MRKELQEHDVPPFLRFAWRSPQTPMSNALDPVFAAVVCFAWRGAEFVSQLPVILSYPATLQHVWLSSTVYC